MIKLSHRCALSFSLSFEREKRRERSVKSGSFYLLLSLFFLFALDSFSSVNTERERYEGIIVKIPRDGFCVAALGTTEATNFGRVTVSVPRLRVEAKSELGRFTSRWGRRRTFWRKISWRDTWSLRNSPR